MRSISHAIRIRAPRARVYDAITTTNGLKQWYSPNISGELGHDTEVTVEAYEGEAFRWKLLSQTPGTGAEWECIAGPGASAGTRVVHRLSETADGRTAVEVDHIGWSEDDDSIATCNTLWGILIGRLRDYAETGEPRPAFH